MQKSNQEQKPISKRKRAMSAYAKYSGMAFQLIFTILLGIFLGKQVDAWRELEQPIFTGILSLLFLFGALYWVLKDFIKPNK